ncbi:MAG: nuclear transport factor 2 family protein [Burkholderiales bacterium]
MPRFASLFALAVLGLALTCTPVRDVSAAGSVEMQVEHLVKQAMEEYNTAMEAGDSASFLKYFASNATRESPLSRHTGRADLAKYFDAEFKTYKASYQVRKMFVQGNSAAILFTWDAVDRKTGDSLRIDMVGLYEVGSSGQFSSATYYFDSAKAKGLADLGK